MIEITTPAMISAVSLKKPACSSCNATGRVGLRFPSTMDGQKKDVHEPMNVNSASIAAAGRAAGMAIERKVRNMDAPSTRAASISS